MKTHTHRYTRTSNAWSYEWLSSSWFSSKTRFINRCRRFLKTHNNFVFIFFLRIRFLSISMFKIYTTNNQHSKAQTWCLACTINYFKWIVQLQLRVEKKILIKKVTRFRFVFFLLLLLSFFIRLNGAANCSLQCTRHTLIHAPFCLNTERTFRIFRADQYGVLCYILCRWTVVVVFKIKPIISCIKFWFNISGWKTLS